MSVYPYPTYFKTPNVESSKSRLSRPLISTSRDIFFGSQTERYVRQEQTYQVSGIDVPCVVIQKQKKDAGEFKPVRNWHEKYLEEFLHAMHYIHPNWLRLALADGYQFYFLHPGEPLLKGKYIPVKMPKGKQALDDLNAGPSYRSLFADAESAAIRGDDPYFEIPKRVAQSIILKPALENIFDRYNLAHRSNGYSLSDAYREDSLHMGGLNEEMDLRSVFASYLSRESDSDEWLQIMFPATTAYIDNIIVPAMDSGDELALA